MYQVKEDVKAKLTMASKGTSGGEGPRNHIQGNDPFPRHPPKMPYSID